MAGFGKAAVAAPLECDRPARVPQTRTRVRGAFASKTCAAYEQVIHSLANKICG